MSTLPLNLHCQTLHPLVTAHGDWLLAQQPKHGLPDAGNMQDCFFRVSGHVLNALEQELAALWPDIPFSKAEFDPELQQHAEHPLYWICDPLDGAVQYLYGLPLWTLTLCLVSDGKPYLSLVYEPASKKMYHAQVGHGAFCNAQTLQVVERQDLDTAMIGTSFPNYPQRPQPEIDDFLNRLGHVIPHVFAQRWMGPASLNLAQLASGVLDGFWETGRSLYDWLPGVLIAQEAGAIITALDGGKFDWHCKGILATSKTLYPQFTKIVRSGTLAKTSNA